MIAHIVRRLGWSVMVLLMVSAITFIIFFAVPGQPAELIAGKYATAETIGLITHKLGLDQPKPLQFVHFIAHAATGDWGYSYVSQQPVLPTLLVAFPRTLALTMGSVLVWLLLGIPLGIVGALRPRSAWDRGATLLALLGISAPVYWLGLVMLSVFADQLGWFPLGDYVEIRVGGLWAWGEHLILPWFTLALLYAGWYAKMTRTQMLEVRRMDFVRTAEAKGVGPARLVLSHILRLALLPLVTMLGMDVAYLMGGAILTESVFGIPGIGRLAWKAIQQRDLPMVMGTVLFSAVFIVLASLVVDLLYRVLDPRIRDEV